MITNREKVVVKAIQKINPTPSFSYTGTDLTDLNSIVWSDDTTPIPVADIEAQIPIAEFEVGMEDLRTKRNELLAETDWWASSDHAMTTEQTTYRQQLRDITNGLTTVEDVNAVVFPTKP